MASWVADGEPLRRIKHALKSWAGSGWVGWADKPHIEDWIAENIDSTKHANPKKAIAEILHEHVNRNGGEVRGQDRPAGDDYSDADIWYYAIVAIDGVPIFVKFIIEPDEPDEPGILIVRIHPPSQ